jgi:nitrogen fixation protein FixH
MSHSTEELARKEATAKFVWTAIILSFFLIQAIIWVVAITLTANDKSHAVVAGYDERALNWDDEVALRTASKKLGWRSELTIDSASDIRGIHNITLKLQDSDESPVANASVQLTVFHRAFAGDPQKITFAEISDGVYEGKIRIRNSGRWQFTGSAQADDATFLIDEQQFLSVSK